MKVICDLTLGMINVISGNSMNFPITNKVRNLKNELRGRKEIVYATTGDRTQNNTFPVDPEQFPKGNWLITSVFNIARRNYKTEKDYLDAYDLFGPVVVTTNACRYTKIWEVKNGEYVKANYQLIRDTSFWIHCSKYTTSWGCILNPSSVLQCNFGEVIRNEIKLNGPIPFEVV